MNKLKFLVGLCALALIGATIFTGCKGKDGEIGPAGANGSNGTNGIDGVDANETCKLCHNPEKVDLVVEQFKFSKHFWGEAAFEEATVGRESCAACHESNGFRYVVENNIPATFTLGTSTKYVNNYAATTATTYGEFSCFTCHSSLHTTYTAEDLPALTTTAAVSMTMWGGAKTINLTANNGIGNLCVKCHQPRPITKSTDSNVLDYANLVSNPTDTIFRNYTTTSNLISLGFRTGPHYGTVGAIYAGMGGIEFGTGYSNSPHTTLASCQDCHMADMNAGSGGHTFNAKGNFNGCNVTGCHSLAPLSSTSSKFTTTRTTMKGLLEQLADKINLLGNGNPLLQSDTDTEANLWYGLTTKNYDGYLNIFDPSSNPSGQYKYPGNTSKWSQAQIDANNLLPAFPSLTKAQFGTILNFQLCLREYSLGIHNTAYTQKLLENSLTAW